MKKIIRETMAIVLCALVSVNILNAKHIIKNDKIMKTTDNKINPEKKVWAWMGPWTT